MNFGFLDQNPDQDFDISCIVIGVQGTEFSKNGKPLNKCTLQDATGRSETLKIYQGNNPPMTDINVGQSLIFKLKRGTYNGRGYYQGFWQCPNPQQAQPQTARQDFQQAIRQSIQQAPQAANYLPPAQAPQQQQSQPQGEPQRNMTYAYEVTPKVMAKKQRGVALEAASRWSIGKADCTSFDILSVAITFYDWLAKGNVPMTAAPEPGREPGEDDEPAF